MRELSADELRWYGESAQWTEELLEATKKARALREGFSHARAAELATDVSYVYDEVSNCAGHPLSGLLQAATLAAQRLAAVGTPSDDDICVLAATLAYLADCCGAAHDMLARCKTRCEAPRPPAAVC
jgi:hypothetical protein